VNPYDAAHMLAKALRESPEFKGYKDAQELLAKDNTAREMLVDFRREQLRLQKQKLAGLEVAPEQQERLNKLFEVLNLNLTVKRYLDAEFRFSRLLADVQKIISDAAGEFINPELMQQLSMAFADENENENAEKGES
jgi:cell fate (sporulation/competence/biofilm development) regulator YlbF (YheA/YmcA/DUF963 family)